MPGFAESFRKGRDAAYAERGFVPRGRRSQRPGGSESAKPADDLDPGTDNTGLLAELTETVEKLQARAVELEAELNDKKKLLTDLVAETERHQTRYSAVEAERDEFKKLLEEVTGSVEQLQAQAGELETERALFGDVLQLPGVRNLLLKAVAIDTHPKADEKQRLVLTEWSKTVNEAYERIKRRRQSAKAGQ